MEMLLVSQINIFHFNFTKLKMITHHNHDVIVVFPSLISVNFDNF